MSRILYVLGGVCLLAIALGCGGGQQTYSRQPIQEVTVTENVRAWLNGVAQSGQLDSGAEIMRAEIEKLRSDETAQVDVDALLAGYDELLKTGSPVKRKSKAKELMNKLPEAA